MLQGFPPAISQMPDMINQRHPAAPGQRDGGKDRRTGQARAKMARHAPAAHLPVQAALSGSAPGALGRQIDRAQILRGLGLGGRLQVLGRDLELAQNPAGNIG